VAHWLDGRCLTVFARREFLDRRSLHFRDDHDRQIRCTPGLQKYHRRIGRMIKALNCEDDRKVITGDAWADLIIWLGLPKLAPRWDDFGAVQSGLSMWIAGHKRKMACSARVPLGGQAAWPVKRDRQ
jgi:hypothetical protein